MAPAVSARAKIEAIVGILVLVLVGIGFLSWLSEHDARLKGEAEIKATKEAFDKLQVDRKTEAAAEADRDRQAAERNAATIAEVAKLNTPQQRADYVTREIPSLPTPAVLVTPAKSDIPNAPAPKPLVIVDAEALDNRLAACKVAENNVATCKADLASRDHDRDLADQQIALLKKDNGNLEKLLGQTKWAKAWNTWIKPTLFAGAGAAIGRLSKK
jgi:hypothetical protein